MATITVEKLGSKLRDMITGLSPGEELTIVENGQVVARIIGGRQALPHRPGPGLARGMITIVADDDEHLKDFEEYMP